ncbi:MAG: hypothetical protein COV59_03910 [Candidatus Magasanikbacteria bacterium CG11_big_fil_rev_8_21_14_0_20_39_34]|uniref:Uncharacterized protein n=1 Tax=Candidatus Magasanikbacteria bacterium CG11_big_fil_rev_8_21_14_0_20_39_34 TaxID=1974653 RepID=A0A2H0N4I2_9BACT|nr:MAG: hypothetical protein COV59_03910 [Candidatus Magasanikbacteria bacterium CG11_big_fil_rev_8_21_14_0_20_39_34]
MAILTAELTQNIIALFGLEKLNQHDLEQALDRIGKIIFSRVTLKVVEILPPEKLEEFQIAIESEEKNPGCTLAFLETNIPHFFDLVNDEISSFKKESDELMKASSL